MTDNEIIKALERLASGGVTIAKESLDLINRQKAEIESLKHRKTELQIRNQELQHEKSEAIKEFAERFAKELSEFDMSSVGLPDYDRGYKDCMTAIEDTIDNLVKEMTEVNEK